MTGSRVVAEVMGAAEVAKYLQLSRQRLYQLLQRPGFPAPVAVLESGKIWDGADIEEWRAARDAGRPMVGCSRVSIDREDACAILQLLQLTSPPADMEPWREEFLTRLGEKLSA